ncbi:uncharacterized protein LOC133792426 [Humulus lupulus]|uniref:uncharacterized protein LOC133792426 n=1 Tax=Humulus lupulus TaxID=3486 RepID=UPI002B412EA1|nr:uncharacterized protein LOC133792426 [Humulus lupulus]
MRGEHQTTLAALKTAQKQEQDAKDALATVQAELDASRPKLHEAEATKAALAAARTELEEARAARAALDAAKAEAEEAKAAMVAEKAASSSSMEAMLYHCWDSLLAHRNAKLVVELVMKLETTQMELEGVVNQHEAAANEAALVQSMHEEALSWVWAEHKEALSWRDAEHKKLDENLEANLSCAHGSEASTKVLLEAAEVQLFQEQE